MRRQEFWVTHCFRRVFHLLVLLFGLTGGVLLPLAHGAHAARTVGGASASATVTGTVTPQEPITLPSDATLSVLLEDVTLQDAPALTIGEQIVNPMGQTPIPFRVTYDPTSVDPNHTYAVEVSITDGSGRLLFTNTQSYPVITQGNLSSGIQVVVRRV